MDIEYPAGETCSPVAHISSSASEIDAPVRIIPEGTVLVPPAPYGNATSNPTTLMGGGMGCLEFNDVLGLERELER